MSKLLTSPQNELTNILPFPIGILTCISLVLIFKNPLKVLSVHVTGA